MGFGYSEHEPFTSHRAVLGILKAKVGEAKEAFDDIPIEVEHKVLRYEEGDEHNGLTFRDFYRLKNGTVKKGTKLHRLLSATKGEKYLIEMKLGEREFEPKNLVGERFVSAVVRSGLHEDGDYSAVKWDTIRAVPDKEKQPVPEAPESVDEEDEDFDDIPL